MPRRLLLGYDCLLHISKSPANTAQHYLGLGFYSAIFIMHLQYYKSKEDTGDTKKTIIFYSHCALYVLSGATFAFDMAWFMIQVAIPFTTIVFFMLINCAVLPHHAGRDQFAVLPYCGYECIIRLLQLPLAIHPSAHKPSI